MVLHHLVRLENIRANLTTPCDIALLAILPIDLGACFVLLNFVKFCLQHFERELAIAPLAALGLATDDDPTGLVDDAHSGFDLIHVLAAFAAMNCENRSCSIILARKKLPQLKFFELVN